MYAQKQSLERAEVMLAPKNAIQESVYFLSPYVSNLIT